jgi:hypothetical protein
VASATFEYAYLIVEKIQTRVAGKVGQAHPVATQDVQRLTQTRRLAQQDFLTWRSGLLTHQPKGSASTQYLDDGVLIAEGTTPTEIDAALRRAYAARAGEGGEAGDAAGLDTVRTTKGWQAHLIDATGTRALGPVVERWDHGGIPAPEIALYLNQLATEGWGVQDVAEDRAVYSGVDTSEGAAPIRIRYLLRRDLSC